MSFTRAVSMNDLAPFNQPDAVGSILPLCPACKSGRLKPYEVRVEMGGLDGIDSLGGYVAVCVGNQLEGRHRPRGFGEALGESPASEPCGLTMPLTATPSAPS